MTPITYEITATVAPELVGEYEAYMRAHHIPALLATGRFRGASFARSSAGRYRIRYEAADQAELDRYLAAEASGLRAEFVERFPTGVELGREVWTIVETWNGAAGSAASPSVA
jgi:hypothetical protein